MNESSQLTITTNSRGLIPFDSILTEIGIGPYQYIFYFIITTIAMTEGSQLTIFTLTIPILKHQWGVEDYLNNLQASLVFIGFLVGSLISGQVADRWGRKKPFLISATSLIFVIYGQIMCTQILQLIILRGFLGILVGFFAPLGASMVTEITPDQYRAKVMCLVQFSVSIGQVLGLIIGYFTLKDLKDGDWRLLIMISGLPGIAAVAVALFFVDDSARFLICSGEYDESFKILEKMNKINGRKNIESISEESREGLKKWSIKLNESLKETKVNIQSLFKGDFKLITPVIWWNWFVLSFIYYGILILLPSLLDKISSSSAGKKSEDQQENKFQSSEFDLVKLIVSSFTEMLACFLAALLVDTKGLGRKNSVINFSIILFIALIMCYYDNLSRFIFWSSLSKFYILMITIFNFQYTCEVYYTKIRTTGLGVANGIGKSGGILMPWICGQLSELDLMSPFLLFAFMTLAMAFLTMQLPYDTLGREMDKIDEEKEKIE